MNYQKSNRQREFKSASDHHKERIKKTMEVICAVHNEIEPEFHNELFWSCPRCSKDAVKNIDLNKAMRNLVRLGLID